jgi:hypothetical protein
VVSWLWRWGSSGWPTPGPGPFFVGGGDGDGGDAAGLDLVAKRLAVSLRRRPFNVELVLRGFLEVERDFAEPFLC